MKNSKSIKSKIIYLSITLCLFIQASSCKTKQIKIHEAAYKGNLDILKKYFDNGGKVDTFYGGKSLLIYAIAGNQTESVKYLVRKGADVKAEDKYGKSPIHFAVQTCNDTIIKLLIDKGADVNVKVKSKILDNGETPLMFACNKLSYSIVKLLITNGANINDTSVHGATAVLNALDNVSKEDSVLQIIKFLVENGADINKADDHKTAPIALASLDGYYKVVKYLIDNKAEINAKGEAGNTALSYAAIRGYDSIFNYLILKGANISMFRDDGSDIFLSSIESKNLSFIKSLISDYKLTPIVKDNSGANALMYAAKKGNRNVILYLLNDLHFNIDERDYKGKTALFYAVVPYNNFENISCLIENRASINIQDYQGNTMLSDFVFSMYIDDSDGKEVEDYYYKTTKYLLQKGADKSIKNKYEKRPIDYIDSKEESSIKKLLN